MVEIPSEELPFLYGDFMRQIKNRLQAMRDALERLRRADTDAQAYIELEFCVLQLRLIIELMALASLTAHNEIADFRSKTFVKTWNADVLIREMAKHSPSAFPTPIAISDPGDDGIRDLEFRPLNAETQDKIVRIYRMCGDILHVGHLRSLIKSRRRKLFGDEIASYGNLIIKILEQHVVILPGMRRMMFAFLRYQPTNDVHCFLSDFEPDGTVDPRVFPTRREDS